MLQTTKINNTKTKTQNGEIKETQITSLETDKPSITKLIAFLITWTTYYNVKTAKQTIDFIIKLLNIKPSKRKLKKTIFYFLFFLYFLINLN